MTLITETATGLPVVKHSERVAQAATVGILQLETGLSACPCGRLLEVVAVMMRNLVSDEQHRSPNPVIMVLDIMSHDGRAPFEPRIKTRADRSTRTEVTETALGGRFPALLCALPAWDTCPGPESFSEIRFPFSSASARLHAYGHHHSPRRP